MVQSENIFIESDYEYVLGSMIGQAIQFQAEFENTVMPWTRDEAKMIASDLEFVSRRFAIAQDIDGSKNQHRFARGSPTAIEGITGYITEGGTARGAIRVVLTNLAKKETLYFSKKDSKTGKVTFSRGKTYKVGSSDKVGGYYGGHIEYGHRLPDGNFYPARPYLRPALRTVSEASVGPLSGALSMVLSGSLVGVDRYSPSAGKTIGAAYGTGTLPFGKKTTVKNSAGKFPVSAGRKATKASKYTKSGKSQIIHEYQKIGYTQNFPMKKMETQRAQNKLSQKYSVQRSKGHKGNIKGWGSRKIDY